MRCRATGQQTRLAERTGQKIVLQRQLPDLRMQRFHIDDRLRLGFRCRAKHPGRALQELIAPLLDLVRVSGMQTCPAGNRWTSKSCASSIKVFLPLIAATATSPLKAGLWFWRGRLVMVISSLAAVMPPWRGKSTYPGCSVFPNHLS
jgi:hypothetical protein